MNKENNQQQDQEEEGSGLEEIKEKLEGCEQERDEYLKGWQRQRAEFLNYKKEEAERVENLLTNVQSQCVLEVIEVYDDFERALGSRPEELADNAWVRGVVEVKKHFERFFERQEVEAIGLEGEQFNPKIHEAVERVRAGKDKSGKIVEVIQKGYLIKGRLLRPAKVKVAS